MSWDQTEGAYYYKVYYDDTSGSSCRLAPSGEPRFCELLADNVSATSCVHSDPGAIDNYSWVAACNGSGCSDIYIDDPAIAWSAAEFMARHHVIDGALGLQVREDPSCTADCEDTTYPGDGSRNLATMKAVTGIDLALTKPGQGSYMAWVLDSLADGRISNLRVVLTKEDIDMAREDGDFAIMFYLQRRSPSSPGNSMGMSLGCVTGTSWDSRCVNSPTVLVGRMRGNRTSVWDTDIARERKRASPTWAGPPSSPR